MTSLGFLFLAAVLRRAKYPWYTVVGQIVQYGTTEMVWIEPPQDLIIWIDRVVATTNIVLLAREHHVRGISKLDIVSAFSATLIFYMLDWNSPWCWRVNMVANNVRFIYSYGPLPWYIYMLQHVWGARWSDLRIPV
jgi:hypothetical protein